MDIRFLIGAAALTLAAAWTPVGAQQAENYVFSASWEPAFCDSHASKPECQAETGASFAASNFALHGLWSQAGEYCGVSQADRRLDSRGDWSMLPAVVLGDDLESTLSVEMPGVASDLDRHEWTKHGTCSGLGQQDFFADALGFLGSVNGGNLRSVVASNAGGTVQLGDLVQAATSDYGDMASQAVEFLCDSSTGQQMLAEIRLHLALPTPMPQSLDPSYFVAPTQPASAQQLCGDGPVYIEIVN
jgi:ribonuclease T2